MPPWNVGGTDHEQTEGITSEQVSYKGYAETKYLPKWLISLVKQSND